MLFVCSQWSLTRQLEKTESPFGVRLPAKLRHNLNFITFLVYNFHHLSVLLAALRAYLPPPLDMPALAFGLKAAKPGPNVANSAQKRKAFNSLSEDEDTTPPPQPTKKSLGPVKPLHTFDNDDEDEQHEPSDRPAKSPKLSHPPKNAPLDKFASLSSIRNAKLEDARTASVDPNVYDYDGSYDTFSTTAISQSKPSSASSGPKYMTSLLASSAQRQRDQIRAREKVLQRERDNEGDEFADKGKFVTSAYKKQQEEMRKMEEEEEKKREDEERHKKQGLGMTAFNKSVLRKEDERMAAIAAAEKAKAEGGKIEDEAADANLQDVDEDRMANDLNEAGANIVVNEDGEVVDKRQLLSAGLNAAPKKPGQHTETSKARPDREKQDFARNSRAQDARQSQRERQTRMMERQLEAMADQQEAESRKEEEERAEKNKSKITEDKKMDAKERYLARKREREEAEKAKKAGG